MTNKRSLSFEFFPPKTDKGMDRLAEHAEKLAAWQPEFFSVTYGAGGSTRDRTFETVDMLRSAGHDVAPHLSFGQDDEAVIADLVERYCNIGVQRIVALRGDVPSGAGALKPRYAQELVAFLRKRWPQLKIEVAAYPEIHPDAPSPVGDLTFLKQKIDAGADRALTQYFFNVHAYTYFAQEGKDIGIDVPIVPGIMPITNHDGLVRFSENCGADVPRWIKQRLEALRDDETALRAFGHKVVLELCQQLLAGDAPGIHFYTLNQAGPTLALLEALKETSDAIL